MPRFWLRLWFHSGFVPGLALACAVYGTAALAQDRTRSDLILIPETPAIGITDDAEPLLTDPGEFEELPVPITGSAAPEILTDPALLPRGVQRTRQRILDAARSGDLEGLRPIMGSFEEPPMVSFDPSGDAIADLRAASGDDEGHEILAILIEVLEAGFVLVDKGTESEAYVWPYFTQFALDDLTPTQMVELFTLVTAYDLDAMREFGAYNFYRAGIAPDGQWVYFISGD